MYPRSVAHRPRNKLKKCLHCQIVAFETKPYNYTSAPAAQVTMMPKCLPCVYIRDMYLNYRRFDGRNGIGKGNRGMGIAASVEYNSVERKTNFMEFVNHGSFVIRLKIMKLDNAFILGKQNLKILFKGLISVNRRFSFAEQIEIRAVDN